MHTLSCSLSKTSQFLRAGRALQTNHRGLYFPLFFWAPIEPPSLADLQRGLVFGSSTTDESSLPPDNIRYCQKVSTAAAGPRATAAPGAPVFGLVTLPTGSYCVCLYGETIVADGRGVYIQIVERYRRLISCGPQQWRIKRS